MRFYAYPPSEQLHVELQDDGRNVNICLDGFPIAYFDSDDGKLHLLPLCQELIKSGVANDMGYIELVEEE